ncbi:hypothetical protein [uncultured Endozoicomonas sp.]|uniref:hypothetical protein n=1 Tax=uncultured Endozoicomonas sp. TaxID=432652 RepID=UPI002613A3C4|nr:hypothetical protein [uncultured Endozoicomonas sp.]
MNQICSNIASGVNFCLHTLREVKSTPVNNFQVLATINQTECKSNCGFVAMRVYDCLSGRGCNPIRSHDSKALDPLCERDVYGKLDDAYMGEKSFRFECFTGSQIDIIFQCEQILLELNLYEHAIVNFQYILGDGSTKGHFINVLQVEEGYQIIDAIDEQEFYRYFSYYNLYDYFHVKLPRVGAESLSKISIIF